MRDDPRSLVVGFHEDVARFQDEVLGFPVPDSPTMLKGERRTWAHGALSEEVVEFMEAETLEDQADALIDVTYFALGRLFEMGLCPGPLFDEVHRANMEKRRGELSKRPGSQGYDAVKPHDWRPPDLAPMTRVARSDVDALLAMEDLVRNPEFEHMKQVMAQEEGQSVFSSAFLMVAPEEEPTKANHVFFPQDRPPRILVLGHARHGKDTASALIAERYGLRFTSASLFCAERIVFPKVEAMWKRFYGASPVKVDRPSIPHYSDAEACFEDRSNHRAFWYEAITEFNTPDKAALGKAIFEEHDIYCGLRNKAELASLVNSGAADIVVWVDGSDRHPPEPTDSCTVEPWMAHFVIDNNGNLQDLHRNVAELFDFLLADEDFELDQD